MCSSLVNDTFADGIKLSPESSQLSPVTNYENKYGRCYFPNYLR